MFTALLAAMVLAIVLSGRAYAKSEIEWTAEWCGIHGLVYEWGAGDVGAPSPLRLRTETGRTVYPDCIGDKAVVEVDFAHKFYEGVGQALFYGRLSRLDPILLLIVESPHDCKYYHDARWLVWESNQRIQVVHTGHRCGRE